MTLGGQVLRQSAAAVILFPTAYVKVIAGPCPEKALRWPQMVVTQGDFQSPRLKTWAAQKLSGASQSRVHSYW